MSFLRENKNILALILSFIICLVMGGVFYHFISQHEDGPADDNDSKKASDLTQHASKASKPEAATNTSAPATGHTVYIETGHGREDNGRWDAGCSWSDGKKTYEEATLMIPIAKAMASYLRSSGVTVITDADSDNDRNLTYALDYLDKHTNIDAFVNIHCDWEEAEAGTMPLYRTDEQLKLARALNKGVHKILEIKDRGETPREDLDTLSSEKVHCPAVLFETGSIREDIEILTKKYDAYGKGLAIGMCEYLGIEFRDPK